MTPLEPLLHALGVVLAAALMLAGLAGAIVPAVPGIPLLFGGMWLIAAMDHYRHWSVGWLTAIAAFGVVGLVLDLIAGALGAKRIGASHRALWGAVIGSVVGMFFGLPGLLLGPFAGAMVGELSAGHNIMRSTHVGVNTWIGLIIGTLMKLVCSLTMLILFAAAWWSSR